MESREKDEKRDKDKEKKNEKMEKLRRSFERKAKRKNLWWREAVAR